MTIVSPETSALIRSLTALFFSACGFLSILRALLIEYQKEQSDERRTKAHRAMVTGLLAVIASAAIAAT